MNKLKYLAFGIALTTVSAQSFSAKIEGVDIPDTQTIGGSSLVLNGAGVRSKLFIDLYIGGLYLTSKSSDAAAIVAGDQAMAINLHIISGMITSDKMVSATVEGFENSTGGNTQAIQPHIDEFISVFKEEIKEGDVFDITYEPGTGVSILKNGDLKKTINGGLAFKKAVFGIWLSDKPAQESLKEEMLGGS